MTSDLYEYLGDVSNGIYPLTAFSTRPPTLTSSASSNRLQPASQPSALSLSSSGVLSMSDPTSPLMGEHGCSRSGIGDASRGRQQRVSEEASALSAACASAAANSSAMAPSVSAGITASASGAVLTAAAVSHCEMRSILQMHAEVQGSVLTLLLKLDDLMNRQLTTQLADGDSAESLVAELLQFGLVAEVHHLPYHDVP